MQSHTLEGSTPMGLQELDKASKNMPTNTRKKNNITLIFKVLFLNSPNFSKTQNPTKKLIFISYEKCKRTSKLHVKMALPSQINKNIQ